MTRILKARTKALSLVVLGGLALVLASCASPPRSRTPAPAPSAPATGTSVGTPTGTPTGASVTPLPGGPQWSKPGASSAEYRADLEACYEFAQARIAHDQRIETDSSAAFDTFPSGLGVSELSGQMNEFERKNRRSSLYRECMRAKGYSAQQ